MLSHAVLRTVLSHVVSRIECTESCCVTDHVYEALLCHGWCGC